MKIVAMLARAKGRDFYDLIFLLSQAKPDYNFLSQRCGKTVDLKEKQKDFEHLLFNKVDLNIMFDACKECMLNYDIAEKIVAEVRVARRMTDIVFTTVDFLEGT